MQVLEDIVAEWMNQECILGKIILQNEINNVYYRKDQIIAFDRVSHKASNLRLEGNDLVCDIDILDNKNGKQLEDLIAKDKIYFAPSGIGRMNNDKVSSYSLKYINAVEKE